MNEMFGSASSFNQDISAWNYSNVTGIGLTKFLNATTAFTTANYDLLLNALSSGSTQNSVLLGAGSKQYTKTLVDSGTTDGAAALKLIQSGQNFLATVNIGDIILNTTDSVYCKVTAVDSNTQLSVDIAVPTGKAFEIYNSSAAKSRYNLTSVKLWTITDGGGI